MKIIAYILGIVGYVVAGFIVMPVSYVIKYIYAKLFKSLNNIYLGILEGWILSGLFLFIMFYIFRWFGNEIPIFFIILMGLSVLYNNYKRYLTRPNKNLQIGYLLGELTGLVGIYTQMYNGGYVWF